MDIERIATGFLGGLVLVAGCGEPRRASEAEAEHGEIGLREPRPGKEAPQSGVRSAAAVVLDGGVGDARAGDEELGCATLRREACLACCDIAYEGVGDALKETLDQCLCADPGECKAVCGSTYCTGQSPTPDCQACVVDSTTCGPATLTVCTASRTCSAYMACLAGCK